MTVTRLHSPAMTAARLEALAAAERTNIREGLPPVSATSEAIARRWAHGQISADQAVAQIAARYRVDTERR